ncbi:CHAT domain-containing protein [bacterium]|nr:CHAT domain-containing protein [bacterium]
MSLRSNILILSLLFSVFYCDTSALKAAGCFTGACHEADSYPGTLIAGGYFPDASQTADFYPGTRAEAERDSSAFRLDQLNKKLFEILEKDKSSSGAETIATDIESLITAEKITDTVLLSDSYYILGHYYLNNNRYSKASENFSKSVACREKIGLADRRYALGLANNSVTLLQAGDYSRAYAQGLKGLEARRAVSGSDSSSLAANYLNLASICLEMNDPEKAINLAESGLTLVKQYPAIIQPRVKADLYQVIGLSLYRTSEYTNSLVYCREALRLYGSDEAGSSDSKLLLLNTISQIYRRLGQSVEAEDYFRQGLAFKTGGKIEDKYLLFINYADFLAESGRPEAGGKVMNDGISAVRNEYGRNSREYCMMMASAGEFVSRTTGDSKRAIELYDECLPYVETHPWDVAMKQYFALMYAETLFNAGMYEKVLEVSNDMTLLAGAGGDGQTSVPSSLFFSEDDLHLLMLRYRALNALVSSGGSTDLLREAISTGRLLVSLFDRLRLEMSEDESRTNLSAFSREIYAGMIENHMQLYDLTGDRESFEGLFEFSERSKVAGFLASMRELNAARFSLPGELVTLENDIRREIGLYRELINTEQSRAMPDSLRLATWESATFRLQRSRDSLVKVFEENYPAYYNLKFRNEVTSLKDVTGVIGKNSNLLSYVLTEDKLYIFVINRKRTEVIARDIDSTLLSSLMDFRRMLTSIPATTMVRQPFNEFMDLGYEMYRVLLEPAVPFLSGDKIIVSPDNLLSYIPFETLVTDEFRSPELLYREVPFALKEYRFSYIYSVTLSSETQERSRSLRNDLIAFAPTYDGMEIDDSLLVAWPDLRGEIRSLPYAALESEDAVSQCGGRACLAEEATEGAYKSEAQHYKIIHLAMHTLVNDRDPAYSKMIFSASPDGSEDGMLNTYEVYSVPVNAMMVVLSSCNTGVGRLVSGEGLLSLARGFLYAGSRSVLMSMWEVEDKSASTVMHSFYKNMRSGQTKSSALRNARLKFLRSADQGRSHPYYWSALVIYGDDTPLWFNRIRIYSSLLLLLMAVAALIAAVYKGPRS